jgi:hypothetical protein
VVDVSIGGIQVALERCDTTSFEKYAQTVLGSILGTAFKPLGGHKDGGADGFVDADLLEDAVKPTIFFQASKEGDTEGKIRKTVKRIREFGRDLRTLHYATSSSARYLDRLQNDLSDELRLNIRIYDGNFFEQRANYSDDAKAAYFQYMQPAIEFLREALAPSYPSSPALEDARIVSAFLGQELERRLGTTRTMEGLTDALILWALEDTDPDKGLLMTVEEIVAKVERVVPTAKQFFRGEIHHRLDLLTKKIDGARIVNIYRKDGNYCLPYESRSILETHAIEDEALKVSVTQSIRQRLLEIAGKSYGDNMLETTIVLVHRILEAIFERQGFDATRHFLDDDKNPDADAFEARSILEIAEDEIEKTEIDLRKNPETISIVRRIIRDILYHSNKDEREFCARLARTYVLLFAVRNTPEIINYFNTMAKKMSLYVGSDLVIRSLSEYYLSPNDQMTVNALKIIRQSGSKLILTESMLEEVHSHIYASNLEYRNHYLEIDFLVDDYLASQASKILIRSYYYAKFEKENQNRPKTWTQYLNNFLSPEKLSASLSTATMRELKDTLCSRFGFTYEPQDTKDTSIDPEELVSLSKKIQEMRGPNKREILAENDAYMILRVDALRQQKESSTGNPYGFSNWYLTQDTVSNIATSLTFPRRRGVKYVMRPEFLINYIAFNPTSDAVRESLRTIFPSVLGIRLGARLDKKTITQVMDSIRKAHEVDPARAASIVAEHADALKSDRMRDFALKYTQQGH